LRQAVADGALPATHCPEIIMSRPVIPAPRHHDGPAVPPRSRRRVDAWSIALRLLDMAYPPAGIALRIQLMVAVYGSRRPPGASTRERPADAMPPPRHAPTWTTANPQA
jgi:hypothetical protein